MFAVLAEAVVERGEGEIRGKEEAKAEGGARGVDERARTRRVEHEGLNSGTRFLRLTCKVLQIPLRIRRVSTHHQYTYLIRGVKNYAAVVGNKHIARIDVFRFLVARINDYRGC